MHTAVDCGSALAPLNGAINLTATILLSRAYYNCSQGYILKGASSRTCMPDGNWSGEEPTCESNNLQCDTQNLWV